MRRRCSQAEGSRAASRYELLAVEGVPALTPEDHNAARRFITLIDVWYDVWYDVWQGAPSSRRQPVDGDGVSSRLHL